jgi:hypothetical protein
MDEGVQNQNLLKKDFSFSAIRVKNTFNLQTYETSVFTDFSFAIANDSFCAELRHKRLSPMGADATHGLE